MPWAFSPRAQMAEERTVERLPVAAVDEHDDRAVAVAGKKIDRVARARTVADHARRHAARDRPPRPAPSRPSARDFPAPAPGCCIRPRSRRQRSRPTTPALARISAPRPWSWPAAASIRGHPSARGRENMSAIQVSCSAAILRNSARPALVSRITCTRRSVSEVRRSRWPDSTSRSTRPVTLPLRDHHPLRDIRQRHAVRHLVELRHQVEARQRDVEPLAQPAAHLALDQGGAGQQPQPQPELVAVIFREFDGLGLGIEDHDAISTCLGSAASRDI